VADLIFTVCRTEREARRSQSQSTIMVSRPSEGMTMHPAGEDQLPSLRQRRDQLRRRRGAQGEAGRNPRAGIPRDHDRAQPRAHRRGDDHINLENARNHTYKAAWLCETGRPLHLEATMAKLVAADGARHAATYGAEIFGGYGICDEYPVSMFARDAYQIQFSPISNEMSRNMLMQFQGLPKSWA
jgi:hypothetical protein